MKLQDAKTLALQLMNQHMPNLVALGWTFSFNQRTGSFGVCNHKSKEIQLSSILTPACTDESVRNTVLHEIAHALTPGHKHDYIWRRQFVNLGGSGERTGGEDNFVSTDTREKVMQENRRFRLTCAIHGAQAHMTRMPKRKFSCPKCSRTFDPRFLLKVEENK